MKRVNRLFDAENKIHYVADDLKKFPNISKKIID